MLDGGMPLSAADAVYAGKTLVERLTGRFYTPDLLADDLAARIVDALDASERRPRYAICDPFCGDGRLIVSLLRELGKRRYGSARFEVVLRDIDRNAARAAGQAVRQAIADQDLDAQVSVEVMDSFEAPLWPRFDAIVTNPPWELLKPDRRELALMSDEEADRHCRWLRGRCTSLNARFPEAQADRQWGGWGTNLARCGWAHCLRSCTSGGVLGIVLPATILADQSSVSMRRAAFEQSTLVDLSTYPPEARLFARVDQPIAAATFVVGEQRSGHATMRVFDADRKLQAAHKIRVGSAEHAKEGFPIAVTFGQGAVHLQELLGSFETLASLEGPAPDQLWAGRELDETRVAEKLEPSDRRPFVKGRMITRHRVPQIPCLSVRPQFTPSAPSVMRDRIVWRDVARSSQERRMITGLIPAGWVAGNSLHVACYRDGCLRRLYALYAVMSSFVFEFQVRSKLSTGHMSLGVVRTAKIPPFSSKLTERLGQLTREVLRDSEAEPVLEAEVAAAYGLGRDQFALILDEFPKLNSRHRSKMLSKSLWAGC